MIGHPPRPTRTHTLFPSTTRFRSFLGRDLVGAAQAGSFSPLPCEGRGGGGAFANHWFARQRTHASCAGGPDGLGRGAFRISPNHGHPHDLHSPRPRAAMPRMPIRRLTDLALLALALSACSHPPPPNPMAPWVPSPHPRTEEPRDGKGWASTLRSRWTPH